MKKSFRVAAVSSKNLKGDIERNLEYHEMWIERAVKTGVEFVGFPECSLTGYELDPKLALTLESAAVRNMEALARKHRLFVAFGIIERRGRKRFNSHVLTGPRGRVGVTRKINLTSQEAPFFESADDLPVFDIGACKVGTAICADSTYYEVVRVLSLRGADMIFLPHATYKSGTPKSWLDWRQARWKHYAADCCCYFVGCNNAGRFEKGEPGETNYRFASGALILNHEGRVIARSQARVNREVMLVADIRPGDVRKAKPKALTIAEFRGRKFYGNLVPATPPKSS